MFGLDLKNEELYTEEKYILSKNANSIIKLSDYGLKAIRGTASAMKLIGFEGQETIGGRIHLTNYRIIFQSHAANRLKGKFSIFLNTINGVEDISQFISKKIEIKTLTQNFVFVVWGIPALMQEIQSAKEKMTSEQILKLEKLIKTEQEKIGSGLEFSKAMNYIVENSDKISSGLSNIQQIISDPLSLSAALNIYELFKIANDIKKNIH